MSGLTHSCVKAFLVGQLCPLMLEMFDKHRVHKTSYFTGRNVAAFSLNSSGDSEVFICELNNTEGGNSSTQFYACDKRHNVMSHIVPRGPVFDVSRHRLEEVSIDITAFPIFINLLEPTGYYSEKLMIGGSFFCLLFFTKMLLHRW